MRSSLRSASRTRRLVVLIEFLLGLFDDPDLAINSAELLNVVGEFRDPASAPRLLELMQRKDLRADVAREIFKISGFDQSILDPQDHWPDRLWVDSQHPLKFTKASQSLHRWSPLVFDARGRQTSWPIGVPSG